MENEYMQRAESLWKTCDIAEIASALEVRDAACALFVKAMGLREEPNDSDVVKFLDHVNVAERSEDSTS